MIACRFEHTGASDRGRYIHRCVNCHSEYRSKYENPQNLKAICKVSPEIPNALQRAANFAKAAGEHIRNKRKIVSNEVREQRLATCNACPLLVDGVCAHPKCGCSIRKAAGWIDKLGWESSTCPLNKWPLPPEDGYNP